MKDSTPIPDHWVAVEPLPLRDGRTFTSGAGSEDRLRIRYYTDGSPGRLHARAWFGPGAEGPPGHAHGGSLATVLDELMGSCVWLSGRPAVAANLDVSFRNMLPLETEAEAEAEIEKVEGRRIHTRGVIRFPGSDRVVAQADGLFVVLVGEALEKLRERFGPRSVMPGAGFPPEG